MWVTWVGGPMRQARAVGHVRGVMPRQEAVTACPGLSVCTCTRPVMECPACANCMGRSALGLGHTWCPSTHRVWFILTARTEVGKLMSCTTELLAVFMTSRRLGVKAGCSPAPPHGRGRPAVALRFARQTVGVEREAQIVTVVWRLTHQPQRKPSRWSKRASR